MPSWPSSLPDRPLVSGSSIEDEANVVGAPADIGIGQARRRYTAEGKYCTFSWRMNDSQVDDFEDWFHDASSGIAGGALAFDMDDPVSGDSASFQMMPGSRPRKSPVRGGRWTISMQLYQHP